MSGRAFVDSAAYYAYTDKDARDYRHALATVQRLARDGAELYTTNFVVADMYGLILSRMNRDTAQRVLDGLYASATRIVRATEGDERRALEILRRHTDKEEGVSQFPIVAFVASAQP